MAEKLRVDKSETIKKSNDNIDGWANIYTREGTPGVAKSTGFQFLRDLRLTEQTVRQIYRSDGFGAKIVDRPVGDMLREWFDVIGDTDGVINTFLRTIHTKREIKAALTWAKVFGGSIVVMGIDDGQELEEPLDEDNIKSIEFLKVYDRYRVTWTTDDLYDDKEEPKFGTPELYMISPIEVSSIPFKIHETRVLRFDGPLSDDRTFKENNRWNESIYRKTLTQLINVNSSFAASKDILDDFITTIMKIQNLQQMIAAGQDDLVKKRLQIIDLGRHSMNTIIMDENEDWEKKSSSVAGLAKLLQEHQQALSATSDLPMTVLMGRSPGGLNATGDSDIRLYYDQISDAQDDDMLDQLTRLIRLSMLAADGPTDGVLEEDWSIQFNPLWQPTEKEVVETRKSQAETDALYIRDGVLTAAEVAESRFGGDEYSIETEIDDGLERGITEPEPTDIDPDEPEKNNDSIHPNKKRRRKKDTKRRIKLRRDKMFENEDLIEGVTGEENEHTHEFFIFNPESGEGWTDSGGKDNHSHRIEGGTVQPFENKKTGTIHMHTLPEEVKNAIA